MSPSRSKKQDWGAILVLVVIGIIAFLLLPTWVEIIILITATIALIEFLFRAGLNFSPLGWAWHKIFG